MKTPRKRSVFKTVVVRKANGVRFALCWHFNELDRMVVCVCPGYPSSSIVNRSVQVRSAGGFITLLGRLVPEWIFLQELLFVPLLGIVMRAANRSFFVAYIRCRVGYNYGILNVLIYRRWFRWRSTAGVVGQQNRRYFNNTVYGTSKAWFAYALASLIIA